MVDLVVPYVDFKDENWIELAVKNNIAIIENIFFITLLLYCFLLQQILYK